MAPRKPKPTDNDDAASTTSTEHPHPQRTPSILKPNTTKAKVEKPKTDKPKTPRAKAVKKEKVVDGDFDGEEKEKEKEKVVVKKARAKKDTEEDGKKAAGVGKVENGKGGKEKEVKEKPVNGEEAVQLMLGYLRGQNRPYSATEVSANLHNKVTKTVADKTLKEMEQNGLIMGKATKKDGGGQWVFWPLQDAADAASPTELTVMETTITSLRTTNPTLKTTLKYLTLKLNTIKSAPTTSELSRLVHELKISNAEKREKLEGFKSGAVKVVTKEELEKVEKDLRYWKLKRKARRDAFRDVEGMIMDGHGGDLKREDLWEDAGLEEDVM